MSESPLIGKSTRKAIVFPTQITCYWLFILKRKLQQFPDLQFDNNFIKSILFLAQFTAFIHFSNKLKENFEHFVRIICFFLTLNDFYWKQFSFFQTKSVFGKVFASEFDKLIQGFSNNLYLKQWKFMIESKRN